MYMQGISKIIFGIILIFELVGFVGAVRINEVMPHTNNTLLDEWIEIFNNESYNISAVNWKIGDLKGNDTINFSISSNGFLIIVDSSIGCSNFSNCINLTNIGSGLNDDLETVYLFNNNSVLIDNFSWSSKLNYNGTSWQFYNSSWQACSPTPGQENYCPQQIQNLSNQTTQNQTGQNQTSTTQNNTTTPSINNQTSKTIKIQMDFDSEAESDKEFDVEVSLFNLKEKTYDLKLFIEYEGKMISEIENDGWKSGTYYLKEVFTWAGDATESFKLRLNKNNRNFSGEAKIYARVRESGSSKYQETSEMIEFIEKEVKVSASGRNERTSVIQEKDTNNQELINNSLEGNILRLDSKDIKSYNSTSQKIKELSFIGFVLFCLIILLIAIKNGRRYKSNSDV